MVGAAHASGAAKKRTGAITVSKDGLREISPRPGIAPVAHTSWG